MHIHILYIMKLEKVTIEDRNIQKILKTDGGQMTAIKEQVKKLKAECSQLEKEEDQIQDALARFWIYMKENAMARYNDATSTYLDQIITQAKKGGTLKDLTLYEEQKKAYKEQKKAMNSAVKKGSAKVPNKEDLEKIMHELFLMPLNGKKLQGIVSSNSQFTSLPRLSVLVGTKWGRLKRFLSL